MNYTKQDIRNKCKVAAIKDIRTFYKADFVNYKGKSADTNEYYTEIIAEWILEHLELFDSIPIVSRESGYRISSHKGIIENTNSNRTEEMIAMKMFLQSNMSCVGKILDYQTPLKNKSSDPVGKIDLLSYDGTTLRLLELKKPNSEETMLRCVLEIYTYWKTIDKQKLVESFSEYVSQNVEIKGNPFVFKSKDSNPYLEIKQFRPKLTELIKIWDTKPLFIIENEINYEVTEVF